MAINEIFPNPTVKTVAFEIRFPNLFFLEQKIGDFQLALLETFPESALAFRRHLLFADVAPGASLSDLRVPPEADEGKKIWQFKSPRNYSLDVTTDSMVLQSGYHKTYQLGEENRFRDIIQLSVDALLAIVKIPLFQRIGIRYIDEGPIPDKTNESLRRYYRTTLPLDRFSVEDAREMNFVTLVRRGQSFLRYAEALALGPDGSCRLIMDFDGFREHVPAAQYLSVTDELHRLISDNFDETITEELKQFMRQPQGARQ